MKSIRTLIWKETIERLSSSPKALIIWGVSFSLLFAVEAMAVSSAGAAGLGSFILPAVFAIAVMGASLVALDSFVGERERGTMEMLLTEPVSETAILAAKGATVMLAWAALTLLMLVTLVAGDCVHGGLPALKSFPWAAALAGIFASAAAASLVAAALALTSIFVTSMMSVQMAYMLVFFALQFVGIWALMANKVSPAAMVAKLNAATSPETWVLGGVVLGVLSVFVWLLAGRLYRRERLASR
jgi:Cu-processing system permease protein